MAVRKATGTDEGDRLLIVNDDDGSIACYTLLRSQNVIAPSEWTTGGNFLNIGVDVDDIYTVVKRTVNSSDVYYVELFDADTLLDSAKTGGAAASVTMDHLEGETVKIVRDGIIEPDQVVPATPFTVAFATAAGTSYQVGLNFTPEVKTLPVEPRLSSGSLKGFKKRIFEVNAELFETQSLTIDGKLVPFRQFGSGVLGGAVPEYTGIKTLHSMLGYTYDGQITIGQEVPLKMTLLGIDYKVSAGQ
jgi:bifunctional DNA-binding transcriptional regulator/antitoxin component of YhaV-PrlF toxin-antitoxin module